MGIAYSDHGMPWKAMEAYHKAIQLKPDFAEVYNNLGNTFKSLKKQGEALEYYDKAITIQANYEVARTAKMHMEAQICDWEAIEKQKDWLAQLGVKKDFVTPWVLLALEDNPARQRTRSELFARVLAQRFVLGWIGDQLQNQTGCVLAIFQPIFITSQHVFNGWIVRGA